MTKADILLQVKKAEKEAESMINESKQAKEKKIIDAKSRARELIEATKKEAIENAEQEIARAKDRIKAEKEKIIQEGLAQAQLIKTNANKNIAKSTDYLLDQFERTVYAQN
jgi:V/A-type H+-transporting ATPase subunit G/H